MANHHNDQPMSPPGFVQQFLEQHRARNDNVERAVPKIELGRQHDFPAGKYGPDDEGSIGFAVGHDKENGKVFVQFATPVSWLAMEPEQAVQLAEHLIARARKASKRPLAVSI